MNAEMFEEWFGLAQALDRIGDRWTLLIVRELLLGRRRFRELRGNLPGIGANELADRLREMESNGLIAGRALDGADTYELTENGRDLEAAVLALIRWGGRSLPSSPPRAEFRPERLALALEAALPAIDDLSLEVRVATGGRSSVSRSPTATRSLRPRPPRRSTTSSTWWSAATGVCSSRSSPDTCRSSGRRSAGSSCTAPGKSVGS
jgi:DNA-binding HxlR family transcriptional regulator